METLTSNIVKLLNRDFKIVFTHNKRHRLLYTALSPHYRRVVIGAGQIAKYVGEENAEAAILKVLNSKHATEQTYEKKYRTLGRLTFYRK